MNDLPAWDETTERCDRCGVVTAHRISVEFRTVSTSSPPYEQRHPYRVAVCEQCGETTTIKRRLAFYSPSEPSPDDDS